MDTLDEIAGQAGCSRSTVGRFFTGRPCELATVRGILAVLGLDLVAISEPIEPLVLLGSPHVALVRE